MAAALSIPPAPEIPQLNQGPGAQPQQAAAGTPPQMPAPAPAPTHDQTVAALRHLHAVAGELKTILKDPNLGKADIKSSLIEAASKLVGSRILSAAQAVQQLAQLPERPFEQKQWIEQQYAQTVDAQAAVLQHHRSQAMGTGDYDLESLLHTSDPEKHQETMRGMMQAHYG